MKHHLPGIQHRSDTKAFPFPLAALVLLASMVSPLHAQVASSSTTPPNAEASMESSSLSHGDKKFVRKVARASTNEVALSRLVDSRSTNSDVKAFAQMMITDHTQANNDLSALAASKSIDIGKQVSEGTVDGVSSLSIKSGADFDQAYAKLMVKAHEGAVKLFKDEVAEGKDTDVVAFAKKYVDTLSMHLDHATSLEKMVNP